VSAERRALAALIAGGLAVRLVLLLLRGDYLVYDEAYYLLLARALREGRGFELNGLAHVALSPLQPVAVAALSLLGLPDLLASRLLGAASGALLPLPVAALGSRLAGPRGGVLAAALVAFAPALMSFTPFFPGVSWNLYFGSEPLFLLIAFGATAAAVRAAAAGPPQWWCLVGVLCGLAFLARAEGLVFAPLVMAVAAARVSRAGARAWKGWLLAAAVGVAVAAPYLWYLRSSLGRWALSGRVQMRGAAQPAVPTSSQRGGAVLEQFVWGGNEDAFRAELYRLTPDGRRMQSQYWGVAPPESSRAAPHPPAPAPAGAAPPTLPPGTRRASLWLGLAATMPWWLIGLGAAGLAVSRRQGWALAWLAPAVVTAALPAALVYVEPRSLLVLVPVAAIGAGALWAAALQAAAGSRARPWLAAAAVVLVVLAAWPAIRDGWMSRRRDTPLQQLAAAQRAVGVHLGRRLPPGAVVMSWHPAVAVWAHRDWRVLPWEPLDRIIGYARGEGVAAVVLSRFNPSPLTNPPRSFTAILLDGGADPGPGRSLRLDRVEETPLLFVGRIATEPPR